jgi:hypothetical protein
MATELSLSTPSNATAGTTVLGSVTYFGPELSGQIKINLTASKGGEVPPSVIINLNQSNSVEFPIALQNVTERTIVTIKAESSTAQAQRNIIVHPAVPVNAGLPGGISPAVVDLIGFSIEPAKVVSGQPSVGRVWLNRPVIQEAINIALNLVDSTQSAFVSFPPSVTIASGDFATFVIQTQPFGGPDRIAVIRAKGVNNVKDDDLYMQALPLPPR